MSSKLLGRYLWGVLLAALLSFIALNRAQAGEYHAMAQSICSDCHSMHSSESGKRVESSPFLLKSGSGELGVCLSCHGGEDPQAPDIVATGTAASPTDTVSTPYTSKYGSSAGCFQVDSTQTDNLYGHGLSTQARISAPLSNTYTKSGGLVCSDCHDPHGTPNYRNLLSNPNPNRSNSVSVLLNTDVFEKAPVDLLKPNAQVAYDTENISFSANTSISAWCIECHDQLATNATGSVPAHFKGHPSCVNITGDGLHTDQDNWLNPSGNGDTGFGTAVGDTLPGIPRLRYGSPTHDNQNPSNGDTIQCLTCHKAHGSKYKYDLVWPYFEGGADMLSGCQQCHYK
ncbi:MAG: cytochrome c3 family protein [Capsulimonadaceae bacterium]